MLCPYCGRDNRPTAKYCAYCQSPLSQDSSGLAPGQTLDDGHYRIVRPLGKGGMGAVYLAEDKRAFDRLRVIKEVIDYFDPADPTARREAVERFEAEARTLSILKNPGIPDLIAYFSESGHNYLVMEYIEGDNLAKRLTHEDDDGQIVPGKPYPQEEALQYVVQVCGILEYLAEQQPPVIHNDIKPANVIIEKGRAVLVDFGTAKARYAQPVGGQPKKESVYGTAGYAAPELYQGLSEPRSDVYALAATAYHLLTDDDPRDHLGQFPKINTLPAPLSEALKQALETDVSRRLDAAQLRRKLEDLSAVKEAPFQPLTFPGGDKAADQKELIALCLKHWDYSADILYDQSIANWLSRALHDPAMAKEAREATGQYPQDRNAGLDAFIRAIDPKAMPAPKPALDPAGLEYGQLPLAQVATKELKIRNVGGGYLQGQITVSAPWIKVAGGQVGCLSGRELTVPVTVDTGGLTPGNFHHGSLTLTMPSAQQITVPVGLSIPPQSLQVDRKDLDFGTVASSSQKALVPSSFTVTNQGYSRAVCRITNRPDWLHVNPETFTCPPGGSQKVEVWVYTKSLAEDRTYTHLLKVETPGAREAVVRVKLQIGRPVGTARSILEATWWFLWSDLPSAISALLQRLAWIVAVGIWPLAAAIWYFGLYSPGSLPQLPSLFMPKGYPAALTALNSDDAPQANQILAQLREPLSGEQVREMADSLNGKMATVQAGEFVFGSDLNRVWLESFQIDKYEVTNVQYLAFVQDTGHSTPPYWTAPQFPKDKALPPPPGPNPGAAADLTAPQFPKDRTLHPVVEVTLRDAQDYCAWAGKRLPNDEEWEAAARGPNGFYYPWSNTPDISPSHANYDGKVGDTKPVGSYPQGASVFYGTMDMVGNVWEWTNDGTFRGGSWQSTTPSSLTSSSGSGEPNSAYTTVGFRCAATP